ncbi:hypothetical protein K3495_g13408 [Podosphaera aphanis]|nr:hypothetical protein K3495_g13408 [Podosphaera aphanis]
MKDDKDTKLDVPVLSKETHERWFRNMSIRLRAKGVLYVTTTTLAEFALANLTDITAGVADLNLASSEAKSSEKGYNMEMKSKWMADDAVALTTMMRRLNEDDEALVDEHPSAKEMWNYLRKKYTKSSPVMANDNLTAIQTFDFDDYPSVTVAWDKLQDFRRKLGVASPDMKKAYTDSALFLVLIRSLPRDYASTIDGIAVQVSLTIDEKLQYLVEKESRLSRIQDQAHVSFQARGKKFVPHQHRQEYSSSSDGSQASSGKCMLCREKDHWLRFCPFLVQAQDYVENLKEHKKVHFKQSNSRGTKKDKYKSRESSKARDSSSRRRTSTPPTRSSLKNKNSPQSGYVTQEEAPDSELPASDQGCDSDEEVCALTKEQIKFASSNIWPADTACTSHMSDQPALFSHLSPIRRRTIRVGGRLMYAEHKGTAKLVCEDGSCASLPNTLYVPGLGVNLLSAKQMCEAGLFGSFDDSNIYFRDGQSLMIHAEMDRGLYIVRHVSRKLSDKLKNIKPCNAFTAMDMDPTTNQTMSANNDMSLAVKPLRPIYDNLREKT